MAHLVQLLLSQARLQPEKPFSHCRGRSQSVEKFAQKVAAFTALLTEKCGLCCGDRVAVAAMNTDTTFQCMLAVLAGGGLLSLVNWRWSLQDAVEALTPCSPSILLVDSACEHFAALLEHVPSIRCCYHIDRQQLNHTDLLLSNFSGRDCILKTPKNGGAVLCFTSGTTAAPKAAMLSHTALHIQSMSKLINLGYNKDDVYYHAAPLCHIGGLSSALAVLMAGGFHVFPGRFNASSMKEDIEMHQVSCSIMVPAMLIALAAVVPPTQSYRSVKRLLIGGGTPLPSSIQQCRTMFPEATVHLSYAMTEAGSSMTFALLATPALKPPQLVDAPHKESSSYGSATCRTVPPAWHVAPAVCVGRPAAGVEISIRSLNGLPQGQGIILTRGPHLMSGYWCKDGLGLFRRPESWFETGDVGFIDRGGELWLAGRLNDTIRTGSETVHASEVERCLASHPAVVSAAVVGLPDDQFGQQVAALVQLRTIARDAQTALLPFAPSERQQKLQNFCKSAGLSGFKIPRTVICQIDPLPVNGSGKLLKVDVKIIICGANSWSKL